MSKQKISFSRKEMILLALMAAVNFNHIVDFVIMMPLGPLLMRMFQISPHQFGLLVSSYTFSAGASGLLASFFIDRFDRKSCLIFFYLGFGFGTLACALAPTYITLLLTRSITGVFGGVLGALVLSIVSDAISYERRGTAMGIVMGSFSLASVLGVPFGLYLANLFGWHAPFVFLGLFAIINLVGLWLWVPSMKGHLNHSSPRHTPIQSLRHILRTPKQVVALSFIFFLVLGQFSIIPFLSQSFIANSGMLESQLPLIYLFGGICSMFASPLVGRLSDRFGKKIIFQISVWLSLLPILGITNLGVHPLWVLLAISSSFFIVMSGRMVPAMAMISATATPEYRGSFMSITSAVQQFSAALASYIAGMIVVQGEAGHLLHFDKAGYFAVIFSLLAFLFSNWLQQHEKPQATKVAG